MKVSPTHIAIQGDGAVTLGLPADLLGVCEILHTICHNIGVSRTPVQRTKLHHGNEPGQIVDLSPGILPMDQP